MGSHIVVRLAEHQYALPTSRIREMLRCPHVTPVPQSPPHVRGLVNLRGAALPLVDLRARLGMPSRADETRELIELLSAREQDHQNWVATFEACVKNGRELTVQTDPHLCAFGRWYDGFKTSDRALSMVLPRFERPHAAIHQAAVIVTQLLETGDQPGVERVLAGVRADLEEMVRLFEDARRLVESAFAEIAVVLDGGGRSFAITVDAVEAVEELRPEPVPEGLALLDVEQDAVHGIGRRAREDGLTLLLDVDALFEAGDPGPGSSR